VIDVYKRNAKWQKIKPYCHFAKDDCFIEVTEWYNGEGFDVLIEKDGNSQRFSLTMGEWECLTALVNYKDDANG